MTAFDSLNPFAQRLVKTAAVLGNTCVRSMLVAVMDYPGKKQFAEDIGINLPKYAFCSMLKFRTPVYRDTAYDLLTDDQKKEIHTKAVDVLEGEAHRCTFCGGGPFFKVPSLSAPLSEWLSAYEGSTTLSSTDIFISHFNEGKSYVGSHAVEKIVLATRLDEEHGSLHEGIKALKSHLDESAKDKYFHDRIQQNIQQCESAGSMGICISKIDLRQCECHVILSSVFIHLIEHARAAGLKSKLIPFLIEFGTAAVPLGLNTQAAKLLGEAEILLQEMPVKTQLMSEDCTWFVLGKIKILQGQALCDLGHYQNALSILLSALEIFGHSLPKSRMRIKTAIFKESVKHWMIQNLPYLYPSVAFGSRALYSTITECLSLIYKIKMTSSR